MTTSGTDTAGLAEWQSMAPQALLDRLQALAGDFELAYAKNTLRTWRADWRVWSAFCARTGFQALPASLDGLRAFLLDRIEAGRQRGTLEHYLATLAMAHRLAKQQWPLDTLEGKLMWRGLRRSRLQRRQRQAKGLRLEDRARVLATLNEDEPRDVRDAALLCVAYETMCRRSELVALTAEQVTYEDDDSGRVFLAKSKTDQEGEGAVLYLSPPTAGRVRRWCELAGITRGPLFRAIPYIAKSAAESSTSPESLTAADAERSDERYPNALDAGDVARIFKRRAIAAGVPEAERISGHSTRVGAAQDLLAKNFSGAAIMQAGRWTTERMVIRYGQHLAAGQGAMAQLLNEAHGDATTTDIAAAAGITKPRTGG